MSPALNWIYEHKVTSSSSYSRCIFVLRGHLSTVRCLKVLDGRPIVISGSRDATLRVWDIENGVQLRVLAGHQHSVRCIEIVGNIVVSGSYDTTCRVSRTFTTKAYSS